MARVTVEDCLDKVENRFALVLLVTKRAKQLMRGANTLVRTRGNKIIVTTLREIANGNVYFEIDESLGTPEAQMVEDLNR